MKRYILVVMALAFSFFGCDPFFTFIGDIVFDNHDNVEYSCFIDDEYQGTVHPHNHLTVYDVFRGSTKLKITSDSQEYYKNIHLTTKGYRWSINYEVD